MDERRRAGPVPPAGASGGAGVLAAALAALLAACATAPDAGLLRRHATREVADTAGLVRVSVFTAPLPAPAPGPALLELSKSAQAELIEALAERATSLGGFRAALAAPAGPDPAPGAPIDRTRFRRKLVVSVEGPDPADLPAARVSGVRLAVGLDTTSARFTGWDRFATRHETVELGTLRLTRQAEAGVRLDLEPRGRREGLRAGGGLAAEGSAELVEELRVAGRSTATGVLLPDSLILLQRGAVGVDVAGNSVVEVEIRAAPAPPGRVHLLEGLFDGSGRPRAGDAVRVREATLLRPARADGGIVGALGFGAVTRTVRPGPWEATLVEGDDRARYLRTRGAPRPVLLVPEGELRTSVWEVVGPRCRRVLHLDDPATGRPGALHLAGHRAARDLVRWLAATRSPTVGGRSLRLGPAEPLRPAAADSLRVRLLPLNWRPGRPAGCP